MVFAEVDHPVYLGNRVHYVYIRRQPGPSPRPRPPPPRPPPPAPFPNDPFYLNGTQWGLVSGQAGRAGPRRDRHGSSSSAWRLGRAGCPPRRAPALLAGRPAIWALSHASPSPPTHPPPPRVQQRIKAQLAWPTISNASSVLTCVIDTGVMVRRN